MLHRTHLLAALVAAAIAAVPAAAQVRSHQKISIAHGGLLAGIDDNDRFGRSVASLGDLDGDGVADLAVGAPLDDDGGPDRGAVWILFLNADRSVKSHAKISTTQGWFTGLVLDGHRFGSSLASIGDFDGDGVTDLAVGAPFDDDGGTDRGALWLLFLRANGTVKAHRQISDIHGEFFGMLSDGDEFGAAVTPVGDLDGDGVPDLLVGAPGTSLQGPAHGAAWILFLQANGKVKSHRRIGSVAGFTAAYRFGTATESLGDLDGDGVTDVAISAPATNAARGAVWIVFLRTDGTVRRAAVVGHGLGGFPAALAPGDAFGSGLSAIGDHDGDGVVDLAVGAPGGDGTGALWLLFLTATGAVHENRAIGDGRGAFAGPLDDGDGFGMDASLLGDLDGDGAPEAVAGAYLDDDGGADRGAAWILSLEPPVFASWTPFGTGCAGTAGVVTLSPTDLPVIGRPFRIDVTNLPSGQGAFGIYGLSRTLWAGIPLPVELTINGMPGCFIHASLDLTFPLPNPGGSTTWTSPIPNLPALLGATLHQQVFAIDPGANPAGATTSGGVSAAIGNM